MGYRVAKKQEVKEYFQLINPDGRVELIACKQQPNQTELYHVYSLELEMKRTKAVRGFFGRQQDLQARPPIGLYVDQLFL